jgi:hypothetical protein
MDCFASLAMTWKFPSGLFQIARFFWPALMALPNGTPIFLANNN